MKGKLTEIGPAIGYETERGPARLDAPAGKLLAKVALEDGREIIVDYWPELLEQWGPDSLRVWLVQQAVESAGMAAAEPADPAAAHQGVLGEAEAAPVCGKGEVGCTDEHVAPEAKPAASKEAKVKR